MIKKKSLPQSLPQSDKKISLKEIDGLLPKDSPPDKIPPPVPFIEENDFLQEPSEKLKKKTIFVDIDCTDYNQLGFRTQSRILAMQALYAIDNGNSNNSLRSLLRFSWASSLFPKSSPRCYAFASKLIKGTLRNLSVIDKQIQINLTDWTFDRLALVNKAILRISIFSLIWLKDITNAITIDEAVNLAKWFGDDNDYRFINGILHKIHEKTDKQI